LTYLHFGEGAERGGGRDHTGCALQEINSLCYCKHVVTVGDEPVEGGGGTKLKKHRTALNRYFANKRLKRTRNSK